MALFQGTINQIENNTYKIDKIEKSDSDGKQKQYSSNNYPTVNAVTEYVETELEKKADVEYVGGKINEVSKSIANLQNSKANIDDVDDSFKDMQANLNLTGVIVPVGMPHNDKKNKTLTFPNFIWNGRLAYISNPTIDYSSFANGDSYTVVANIEGYGRNKYTAEIELVEGTGLSKDGTYCEFRYYASSSAFSYNFRCNDWFTEGIGVELEKKADTEYVETELEKKADTEYVETELEKKADTEYVETELEKKADTEYVETELEKKADTEYVETELEKKADTEYVETKLDLKLNKSDIDDIVTDDSENPVKSKAVSSALNSVMQSKVEIVNGVYQGSEAYSEKTDNISNEALKNLGFRPVCVIITDYSGRLWFLSKNRCATNFHNRTRETTELNGFDLSASFNDNGVTLMGVTMNGSKYIANRVDIAAEESEVYYYFAFRGTNNIAEY